MANYGRGGGVGRGSGFGAHLRVPVHAQYLPPVLKKIGPTLVPPQTIISLPVPVHTAEAPYRAEGALVVLVAVQLFALGLYLPPVLSLVPPQTIISLPVQTAVGLYRAEGALLMLVAVQVSVLGLYLPPLLK